MQLFFRRFFSVFLLCVFVFQSIAPILAKTVDLGVPQKKSLVVVLVQDDLLSDRSFSSRLQSYEQRVTKKTQSQIVQMAIPRNGSPFEIWEALHQLYYTGLENDGLSFLSGIILVGDVPIPLVSKEAQIYPSIFPYVDFFDPVYRWDPKAEQFVFDNALNPAPEIWHGVIDAPTENDVVRIEYLNDFFDKNRAVHEGKTTFKKRVFFADFLRQKNAVTEQLLADYNRWIDHVEDFIYARFTKAFWKILADKKKASDNALSSKDKAALEKIFKNNPYIKSDAFSLKSEISNVAPDVMVARLVKLFVKRYQSINQGWLTKINTQISFADRWNPEQIDSTISLVSRADELSLSRIRAINDQFETAMVDAAQNHNIDENIFTDETQLVSVEEGTGDNITTVIVEKPLYWNGVLRSNMTAESCSLFRGIFPTNTYPLANAVEANSVYNIDKVGICKHAGEPGFDTDEYGGCCIKNVNINGGNFSYDPGICRTDSEWKSPLGVSESHEHYGATKSIFDIQATKKEDTGAIGALGCESILSWDDVYEKNSIPSLLIHQEPTDATLQAQESNGLTRDLPIDDPRGISFYGHDRNFYRIAFPDIISIYQSVGSNISYQNFYTAVWDSLDQKINELNQNIQQGNADANARFNTDQASNWPISDPVIPTTNTSPSFGPGSSSSSSSSSTTCNTSQVINTIDSFTRSITLTRTCDDDDGNSASDIFERRYETGSTISRSEWKEFITDEAIENAYKSLYWLYLSVDEKNKTAFRVAMGDGDFEDLFGFPSKENFYELAHLHIPTQDNARQNHNASGGIPLSFTPDRQAVDPELIDFKQKNDTFVFSPEKNHGDFLGVPISDLFPPASRSFFDVLLDSFYLDINGEALQLFNSLDELFSAVEESKNLIDSFDSSFINSDDSKNPSSNTSTSSTENFSAKNNNSNNVDENIVSEIKFSADTPVAIYDGKGVEISVDLIDKNDNPVSDLHRININIRGGFSPDFTRLDRDAKRPGIQTWYTGKNSVSFLVTPQNDNGVIQFSAVSEINGKTIEENFEIPVIKNPKFRASVDRKNIVAGSEDFVTISLESVDHQGKIIPLDTTVSIVQEPRKFLHIDSASVKIKNGKGSFRATPRIFSGSDFQLRFSAPGFNAHLLPISIHHGPAKKIIIDPPLSSYSPNENISLGVRMADEFGNTVSTYNSPLTVSLSKSSQGKLLLKKSAINLFNGKGTIELQPVGPSGIATVMVSAENIFGDFKDIFITGSITDDEIKKIKPHGLFLLLTGHTGSNFLHPEKSTALNWLNRGDTNGVATTTANFETRRSHGWVADNGKFSQHFLNPSFVSDDFFRIIFSSVSDDEFLGELSFKTSEKIPFRIDERPSTSEIIFTPRGSAKNQIAFIESDVMLGSEKIFSITPFGGVKTKSSSVTFVARDSVFSWDVFFEKEKIGSLIFPKLFSEISQAITSSSSESQFKSAKVFLSRALVGNSTNDGLGFLLLDSVGSSTETIGFSSSLFWNNDQIGWSGDWKPAVYFSGGSMAGDSTKVGSNDLIIYYGDPTISLSKNSDILLPEFSAGIDAPVWQGKNSPENIFAFDLNEDDRPDLLIQNSQKLFGVLQNTLGNFHSLGVVATISDDFYDLVSFYTPRQNGIIALKSDGNLYFLAINNGRFKEKKVHLNPTLQERVRQVFSGNFNGDNFSDLVIVDSDGWLIKGLGSVQGFTWEKWYDASPEFIGITEKNSDLNPDFLSRIFTVSGAVASELSSQSLTDSNTITSSFSTPKSPDARLRESNILDASLVFKSSIDVKNFSLQIPKKYKFFTTLGDSFSCDNCGDFSTTFSNTSNTYTLSFPIKKNTAYRIDWSFFIPGLPVLPMAVGDFDNADTIDDVVIAHEIQSNKKIVKLYSSASAPEISALKADIPQMVTSNNSHDESLSTISANVDLGVLLSGLARMRCFTGCGNKPQSKADETAPGLIFSAKNRPISAGPSGSTVGKPAEAFPTTRWETVGNSCVSRLVSATEGGAVTPEQDPLTMTQTNGCGGAGIYPSQIRYYENTTNTGQSAQTFCTGIYKTSMQAPTWIPNCQVSVQPSFDASSCVGSIDSVKAGFQQALASVNIYGDAVRTFNTVKDSLAAIPEQLSQIPGQIQQAAEAQWKQIKDSWEPILQAYDPEKIREQLKSTRVSLDVPIKTNKGYKTVSFFASASNEGISFGSNYPFVQIGESLIAAYEDLKKLSFEKVKEEIIQIKDNFTEYLGDQLDAIVDQFTELRRAFVSQIIFLVTTPVVSHLDIVLNQIKIESQKNFVLALRSDLSDLQWAYFQPRANQIIETNIDGLRRDIIREWKYTSDSIAKEINTQISNTSKDLKQSIKKEIQASSPELEASFFQTISAVKNGKKVDVSVNKKAVKNLTDRIIKTTKKNSETDTESIKKEIKSVAPVRLETFQQRIIERAEQSFSTTRTEISTLINDIKDIPQKITTAVENFPSSSDIMEKITPDIKEIKRKVVESFKKSVQQIVGIPFGVFDRIKTAGENLIKSFDAIQESFSATINPPKIPQAPMGIGASLTAFGTQASTTITVPNAKDSPKNVVDDTSVIDKKLSEAKTKSGVEVVSKQITIEAPDVSQADLDKYLSESSTLRKNLLDWKKSVAEKNNSALSTSIDARLEALGKNIETVKSYQELPKRLIDYQKTIAKNAEKMKKLGSVYQEFSKKLIQQNLNQLKEIQKANEVWERTGKINDYVGEIFIALRDSCSLSCAQDSNTWLSWLERTFAPSVTSLPPIDSGILGFPQSKNSSRDITQKLPSTKFEIPQYHVLTKRINLHFDELELLQLEAQEKGEKPPKTDLTLLPELSHIEPPIEKIPPIEIPRIAIAPLPNLIPDVSKALSAITGVAAPLYSSVLCSLKLGVLPVPEWGVRPYIEQLTNRPNFLPSDFNTDNEHGSTPKFSQLFFPFSDPEKKFFAAVHEFQNPKIAEKISVDEFLHRLRKSLASATAPTEIQSRMRDYLLALEASEDPIFSQMMRDFSTQMDEKKIVFDRRLDREKYRLQVMVRMKDLPVEKFWLTFGNQLSGSRYLAAGEPSVTFFSAENFQSELRALQSKVLSGNISETDDRDGTLYSPSTEVENAIYIRKKNSNKYEQLITLDQEEKSPIVYADMDKDGTEDAIFSIDNFVYIHHRSAADEENFSDIEKKKNYPIVYWNYAQVTRVFIPAYAKTLSSPEKIGIRFETMYQKVPYYEWVVTDRFDYRSQINLPSLLTNYNKKRSTNVWHRHAFVTIPDSPKISHFPIRVSSLSGSVQIEAEMPKPMPLFFPAECTRPEIKKPYFNLQKTLISLSDNSRVIIRRRNGESDELETLNIKLQKGQALSVNNVEACPIEGSISTLSAETEKISTSLSRGDIVPIGSTIQTNNGSATLELFDGSRIFIQPGERYYLHSFDPTSESVSFYWKTPGIGRSFLYGFLVAMHRDKPSALVGNLIYNLGK